MPFEIEFEEVLNKLWRKHIFSVEEAIEWTKEALSELEKEPEEEAIILEQIKNASMQKKARNALLAS